MWLVCKPIFLKSLLGGSRLISRKRKEAASMGFVHRSTTSVIVGFSRHWNRFLTSWGLSEYFGQTLSVILSGFAIKCAFSVFDGSWFMMLWATVLIWMCLRFVL